jgi:mRNA interferase RelE/StbE
MSQTRYEVVPSLAPSARSNRDLSEAVAFAVVGFLYGPLAEDPYRIGKPLRLAITGYW